MRLWKICAKDQDHFDDLFAFSLQLTGIVIHDRPSPFLYSAVTGDYFSALGIQPVLGRFFAPGEGERPGRDDGVVLGYSFWQTRLAGDEAIVGKALKIGGRTATVIGVAPKKFRGTYSAVEMDGYLPMNAFGSGPADLDPMFSDRTARWLTVLGRMKRGVALNQAQAAMGLRARQMQQHYPEHERGIGIRVVPEPWARPDPMGLLGGFGGSDRAAGILLLLLAGLVLLLACANVANLLLARAMVRQREMAVRAALGSGRWRLVRQVLAETAVLSVLGAVTGIVLGHLGSRGLERSLMLGGDFPISVHFGFDWRVFLYALLTAAIFGALVAIGPAVGASGANAISALHDAARSASGGPARHRRRSLLVAGQIAGSLVLLIVASLFVRDLRGAARMDLGFASDHLMNVRLEPQWAGYDEQRTSDFYREVERRVSAISGVQSVAAAYSVPMGYYWDARSVFVDGRRTAPDEQPAFVPRNYIGSTYFETMQMPIVRGRPFNDADQAETPLVAIINETMAERFWPNQDPIGRQFRSEAADAPPLQVVGVAGDSKYINIFEQPQPYFYLPLTQHYTSMRVLHVRSMVPPELLRPQLEEDIHAVGADVPIIDAQTMEGALMGFGGLMLVRLAAIQAGVMGVLGLLLAVIGVYGVAAYGATQRTREIGIRMALGAPSRDVLRLILGEGAMMVAIGMIAGLLGAVGVGHALARAIQMPNAIDPLVFTTVALLLTAITLAACYLPARHAVRVSPTIALRHE